LEPNVPDIAQKPGSRQATKFGLHAPAVAHFLMHGDVPGDTRHFLAEINRRWPDLSFRDFLGAYMLADALLWKTKGSA
jgi:hypothetical protein